MTTSRPVYVRAMRTAALIASAPVFRNCTRSAHGTTLQNRSATSTSSTCERPDTVPCATVSRTARVILGSPYPIATAPSAIVQSTSSRPSVVAMRQPEAWTKCVGPEGSEVPYSASGRLLPVEAPVGRSSAARAAHSFSGSIVLSPAPGPDGDRSARVVRCLQARRHGRTAGIHFERCDVGGVDVLIDVLSNNVLPSATRSDMERRVQRADVGRIAQHIAVEQHGHEA